MLAARGVRVLVQGREILAIPEIGVREGEVLGIVGPNGAGKTTLLSVLACLVKPDEGRVYFRDQEVTRRNELRVRRKLAVVFQEPLLLDGTVVENVELGLKLRGRFGEARTEAMRWLKFLGIEEKAFQPVNSLSGGESRKVSLARALAVNPEILLLDEPFSWIDPATRQELIGDIKKILVDGGITAVLVSHDIEEIEHFCTRVVVLNGGKVEAEGSPRDVADRLGRFL